MPKRPLYRTSAPVGTQRDVDGHAGLWHDKFCIWNNVEEDWRAPDLKKEQRLDWLKGITSKPAGNSKLLEEHITRRQHLLAALGGLAVCVKSAGRFVTGLGYRHPIENGFAWHPALGTPYLPGSGLKGVARAWALLSEDSKEREGIVKRIFGPRSDSEHDTDHQTGSVIFLEAIPREPVHLVAEVMTPHYGPYYKNEAPPGDYHDPNPISFLAVESGARFLAGLFPRRKEDADDAKQAHGWLLEALEWLGAGAKTATGYGRFQPDTEGDREWEAFAGKQAELQRQRAQQERLLSAGPVERMQHRIKQLSESGLYELVIQYLEKGGVSEPAEKEAFRLAVRESPFFKSWQRGRALDPKECRAGEKRLKQIARLVAGS